MRQARHQDLGKNCRITERITPNQVYEELGERKSSIKEKSTKMIFFAGN